MINFSKSRRFLFYKKGSVYALFGGFIVLILGFKKWILCFWVGDILRGGIRKPSKYFGILSLWVNGRGVFDSGDRGSDNIPDRFPTQPIKFVGWVYGNKRDEKKLRELGVQGEMIWELDNRTTHGKSGIFSHCTITMDVAKKLRDNYPPFTPRTFTGLDWKDRQTIHQPLWKGEYDD